MKVARVLTALLGAGVFCAPLAAFGQQTPAQPSAPSYARPAAHSDEETIHGRITSFSGKYGIKVRDDRGFIDNVEMHQGTVINPTGLPLQPGMAVTIMGYNRGRSFAANEIDTPYQAYGVAPVVYPVSIGVGYGPVYFNHWH